MNNIEDFNFLLKEETRKLKARTRQKKTVTHFAMEDLPRDDRVCKQLLCVIINNFWFEQQKEVLTKIRQRQPNVAFYKVFSSMEKYHKFMCLCIQNDLIEEEYECGNYLERVTIRNKNGKIIKFIRLLKEYLIDHPENAICGFDMTLMKRYLSMGCAVRCGNRQSLITSLYRV